MSTTTIQLESKTIPGGYENYITKSNRKISLAPAPTEMTQQTKEIAKSLIGLAGITLISGVGAAIILGGGPIALQATGLAKAAIALIGTSLLSGVTLSVLELQTKLLDKLNIKDEVATDNAFQIIQNSL